MYPQGYFHQHISPDGWQQEIYRQLDFDAAPISREPWRSTSLADFWGRRWNLAFRDLAYAWVFLPLHRPLGPTPAAAAVFAFSGILHEVALSAPAGAGFGLPTLYFAIQFAGTELTAFLQRLGGAFARRSPLPISPRWVLVDAGPQVLPDFGGRLGARAQRVLRRRGVDVRLSTAVAQVSAAGVTAVTRELGMPSIFFAGTIAHASPVLANISTFR